MTLDVPVSVTHTVVPARISAARVKAVVMLNPPPAPAEAAAMAAVVIVARAVATPVPAPAPVA